MAGTEKQRKRRSADGRTEAADRGARYLLRSKTSPCAAVVPSEQTHERGEEGRGGEGGGAIESIISVGLRALEHTRADVFARA